MAKWTKAAMLNNVFEAQLLEPILLDRGIPYEIKTYHDDVYGALYEVSRGWGQVYAPQEYKEQVAEIVAELRNYDPDKPPADADQEKSD